MLGVCSIQSELRKIRNMFTYFFVNNLIKDLKMNKNELVTKISELSGLTKVDSNKALDAFISAVMGAVKSKKQVRLVGFGTFYALPRKASEGFNPRTRAKIRIAASNRPKFRAGKQFIDTVN
jgi:DNA-binding protein HU-beta